MGKCETCGNEYAATFTIIKNDVTHEFDSFECAIHALAPECHNCGIKIVGHGIETHSGAMYCCAHCARADDVYGAQDYLPKASTRSNQQPGGPTKTPSQEDS